MAKEEWQDPDSGYLNCIGVGDTYVKKQMERILNNNLLNCSIAAIGHITCFRRDTKENILHVSEEIRKKISNNEEL